MQGSSSAALAEGALTAGTAGTAALATRQPSGVQAFSAEEEASIVSVSVPTAVVAQLLFLLCLLCLVAALWPTYSQAQQRLVLIAAALIIGGCTIFDMWLFFSNRAEKRITRAWRVGDIVLAFAFSSATILTIWLALPRANLAHWVTATAFCVGYVPLQMLSAPDNANATRISIAIVLGGFAVYLALHQMPAMWPLLTLVVLYGGALFFFSDSVRAIVLSTIRLRRDAEQANRRTLAALTEVAAERDAKTRFIASVSHDLGQPLAAAQMFAEQLAVRDSADPTVHSLNRSIGTAQHMVGNLLHFMRLEADAVTPERRQLEVRAMLHSMSEQFQHLAAAHNITLSVCGHVTPVCTDGALLERCLGNLLDNAIKHSGGSRVLLCCRVRAGNAQVGILDNGVGIRDGEEAMIFEDYRQGSGSQAVVKGGFGLGLSSARRLAQLLDGQLHLEKAWLRGAAFCLTLPAVGRTRA